MKHEAGAIGFDFQIMGKCFGVGLVGLTRDPPTFFHFARDPVFLLKLMAYPEFRAVFKGEVDPAAHVRAAEF